jgi:hypothetical protein
VCDGSDRSGVYLFNGTEVWTGDLIEKENSYQLFKVVVSDFDKKFSLLCTSTQPVTLELKNGFSKDFGRGDIIPIFLDSKLTISNKYNIKFIGGTK